MYISITDKESPPLELMNSCNHHLKVFWVLSPHVRYVLKQSAWKSNIKWGKHPYFCMHEGYCRTFIHRDELALHLKTYPGHHLEFAKLKSKAIEILEKSGKDSELLTHIRKAKCQERDRDSSGSSSSRRKYHRHSRYDRRRSNSSSTSSISPPRRRYYQTSPSSRSSSDSSKRKRYDSPHSTSIKRLKSSSSLKDFSSSTDSPQSNVSGYSSSTEQLLSKIKNDKSAALSSTVEKLPRNEDQSKVVTKFSMVPPPYPTSSKLRSKRDSLDKDKSTDEESDKKSNNVKNELNQEENPKTNDVNCSNKVSSPKSAADIQSKIINKGKSTSSSSSSSVGEKSSTTSQILNKLNMTLPAPVMTPLNNSSWLSNDNSEVVNEKKIENNCEINSNKMNSTLPLKKISRDPRIRLSLNKEDLSPTNVSIESIAQNNQHNNSKSTMKKNKNLFLENLESTAASIEDSINLKGIISPILRKGSVKNSTSSWRRKLKSPINSSNENSPVIRYLRGFVFDNSQPQFNNDDVLDSNQENIVKQSISDRITINYNYIGQTKTVDDDDDNAQNIVDNSNIESCSNDSQNSCKNQSTSLNDEDNTKINSNESQICCKNQTTNLNDDNKKSKSPTQDEKDSKQKINLDSKTKSIKLINIFGEVDVNSNGLKDEKNLKPKKSPQQQQQNQDTADLKERNFIKENPNIKEKEKSNDADIFDEIEMKLFALTSDNNLKTNIHSVDKEISSLNVNEKQETKSLSTILERKIYVNDNIFADSINSSSSSSSNKDDDEKTSSIVDEQPSSPSFDPFDQLLNSSFGKGNFFTNSTMDSLLKLNEKVNNGKDDLFSSSESSYVEGNFLHRRDDDFENSDCCSSNINISDNNKEKTHTDLELHDKILPKKHKKTEKKNSHLKRTVDSDSSIEEESNKKKAPRLSSEKLDLKKVHSTTTKSNSKQSEYKKRKNKKTSIDKIVHVRTIISPLPVVDDDEELKNKPPPKRKPGRPPKIKKKKKTEISQPSYVKMMDIFDMKNLQAPIIIDDDSKMSDDEEEIDIKPDISLLNLDIKRFDEEECSQISTTNTLIINGTYDSINFCPSCSVKFEPINVGLSVNLTTFVVNLTCQKCRKEIVITNSFNEAEKKRLQKLMS